MSIVLAFMLVLISLWRLCCIVPLGKLAILDVHHVYRLPKYLQRPHHVQASASATVGKIPVSRH